MNTRGELQIDPGTIETNGPGGEMEIVVPFTEWTVTGALLKRAAHLTAGLNAKITLVAVHTTPYPATFGCPTAVHSHLVEQLVELAAHCPLPVTPHVVLARSREEGFQFVLAPQATVLVGSRKRFWRTSEERLAHSLVRDGHKVILVHVQ
jgi:hypothetical protein